MSQLRTSVQRLSFRTKEIWLSVLSWMHWSQRRREMERAHLRQQWELMLALHQREMLQKQEAQFRQLLLEALRPVAEAMQRQDSLAELRQDHLQELLMEVLTSLQPSAEAQIYPRIGLPPQRSSFPSLVS